MSVITKRGRVSVREYSTKNLFDTDYDAGNIQTPSLCLIKDSGRVFSVVDGNRKEYCSNTPENTIIITENDIVGDDLFSYISSKVEQGFTYIDASGLMGTYEVSNPLTINNPVQITFGKMTIKYAGDENMIIINSDDVVIEGAGRAQSSDALSGSTVLKMTSATSIVNYHVYARGHKNIAMKNMSLIGIRSGIGAQYNGTNAALSGCGGIYIEKEKPGVVESNNNCSNIVIDGLLISATIAHGIYIDTPILSRIVNTRISGAGGHGIFINGGTTITIQDDYVSSANLCGYVLYQVVYAALINVVAEYTATGYWIRSCKSISMFSPGVEVAYNIGQQPWKINGTSVVGLGLMTTTNTGVGIGISDVNSDYAAYLRGHGILITGGSGINIFTPYVSEPGTSRVTLSYASGTGRTLNTRFIIATGGCKSVSIQNPSFTFPSTSSTQSLLHDIEVGDAKGVNIEWDIVDGTTVATYTTFVTNVTSTSAPIYSTASAYELYVHAGAKNYVNTTTILTPS